MKIKRNAGNNKLNFYFNLNVNIKKLKDKMIGLTSELDGLTIVTVVVLNVSGGMDFVSAVLRVVERVNMVGEGGGEGGWGIIVVVGK